MNILNKFMGDIIMDDYYLYVVLTRTNTMISKIIHLVKDDEYTHAAIAMDRNLNEMYSFGRRYTYNPFIGCFRKEALDKGVYRLCENLPGVIIEVKVSKQQYEKAKVLLNQFIVNGNTYKYNYKGLLYSLSNRSVCKKDRFLCSEFVYYILKESKVADFKTARNLVRPQSLLNVEGKIIYKGNLKQIELQKGNWITNEIETNRLSPNY